MIPVLIHQCGVFATTVAQSPSLAVGYLSFAVLFSTAMYSD